MIIYARQKRWSLRHWALVGAAAALSLTLTWWFSDAGPAASRGEPKALPAAPSADAHRDATPAARVVPLATPRVEAPSQPPAASSAALSVTVAPGVHITPLSVPPGTVPKPAGPTPHDSEPEN
jgi:hypothetical protein